MLAHEVHQATPFTEEILKKIVKVVWFDDQKELAIWSALVTGFYLFLRKSNLVPVSRLHDPNHQLSRRDVKISQEGDLMIITIKWSKTIQFSQKKLQIPIVADKEPEICPVRWLNCMIELIPAKGLHNLFCFWKNGVNVPITYWDYQNCPLKSLVIGHHNVIRDT